MTFISFPPVLVKVSFNRCGDLLGVPKLIFELKAFETQQMERYDISELI